MVAINDSFPSSQFLTVNDPVESSAPIKIHALIYSPPGTTEGALTSPTIIALHYWGGSASTFHHVPVLLQSRQKSQTPHRGVSTVVSISHRGWGLSSSAVPDSPSAYSINALASDVVSLLPQLRAQGLIPPSGYIFCGHSMGGKVAMAASQLTDSFLPEDFPPLCGMLLLAPAPPTPLVLPEHMKEQQTHAYESAESVEWTVRNVLTGSSGDRLYGGQKDLEMIIGDSLKGSEGAKKGWPRVAMAEELNVKPASEDLTNFNLRVLVSRGDRVETIDRVNQETVKTLQARGYSIQVRVLEPDNEKGGEDADVGHLLPLEAPEVVAEELLELLLGISTDKDK